MNTSLSFKKRLFIILLSCTFNTVRPQNDNNNLQPFLNVIYVGIIVGYINHLLRQPSQAELQSKKMDLDKTEAHKTLALAHLKEQLATRKAIDTYAANLEKCQQSYPHELEKCKHWEDLLYSEANKLMRMHEQA